MKRVIEFIKRSSLDRKKIVVTSVAIGVFLFIYAISHISDSAAVNIEESKNSDFKNGNLTTDQTSNFYREKNIRAQNQNERIIQHLKEVDERMAEIAKRFENKDSPPVEVKPQAAPPDPGQTATASGGDAGKKTIRRGQNQSKIMFRLTTQMAEGALSEVA